jgi:hypothetical protein
MARELSLQLGPPRTPVEQASLDRALARMQRRMDAQGFKGKIKFDPSQLLRASDWWYIPFGWIGCFGFIVSDAGEYVNWLGSSSVLRMQDCFWGHEHGAVCGLVEFTIHDYSDASVLLELFPHLQKAVPSRFAPYRMVSFFQAEIAMEIKAGFPRFQNYFVWHAIPVLRRLKESGDLVFTCTPTRWRSELATD